MVRTLQTKVRNAVRRRIVSVAEPLLELSEDVRRALSADRWISEEHIQAALRLVKKQAESTKGAATIFAHPMALEAAKDLPVRVRNAMDFLRTGIRDEVEKRNRRFLQQELKACRPLFYNIEKNPLSDEQTAAVVCFDNRVLLVAAAGSGKTSTLIEGCLRVVSRSCPGRSDPTSQGRHAIDQSLSKTGP